MKKILVVAILCIWTHAAIGLTSSLGTACMYINVCAFAMGTLPDSCKTENNTACNECNNRASTTSTSTTHVVTTTKYRWTATCNVSGEYSYCSCKGEESYSCASGYYGSPTSSTSTACKACPTNATCSGGSTFSCNRGYYENSAGTGCEQCPTSPSGWSPSKNGTTEYIGATDVSECYFASGTTFSDSTGSFTLTDDCKY